MANILWGRKYKIQVVDEKTGKGWDVSQLRCTFRIEAYDYQQSNISIISIYNLDSATETEILKNGNRVIVEAGYEGTISTESGQQTKTYTQYGKIYDGSVVQMIRTKDNNLDYQFSIACLDSQTFLNQNFVAVSLAANSTPRQIVHAVNSQSNSPIEVGKISDDLKETKLPRGKVLFGMPRDYLRDIAYDNNTTFYTENNKLYLEKLTDIKADEAINLTAQTGLIGYPQQTNDGVEFKCLLHPGIKIRGYCKIDNSQVRLAHAQRGQRFSPLDLDGEYQVMRMVHSGDTRGDEWYTSVTGISRLGKGFIPFLMEYGNQNPYGSG